MSLKDFKLTDMPKDEAQAKDWLKLNFVLYQNGFPAGFLLNQKQKKKW